MLVSTDPARLYDDELLTFAEHLGRRAATAVDNALSTAARRSARRRRVRSTFIADGVLLVDEEGTVRIWNAAAEAITGLPERAIVGRRVAEALPGWAAIETHVPVVERPRHAARRNRPGRAGGAASGGCRSPASPSRAEPSTRSAT